MQGAAPPPRKHPPLIGDKPQGALSPPRREEGYSQVLLISSDQIPRNTGLFDKLDRRARMSVMSQAERREENRIADVSFDLFLVPGDRGDLLNL